MKNFLSLNDLRRDEISALLAVAKQLKSEPINNALRNKVVGLLFMNPSLRTLASFQAGVAQLGGNSVVIQPGAGTWSLETRDGAVMDGAAVEHVREAIPVLASYCNILGIRSFADQINLADDLQDRKMKQFAQLCAKPMINMESASDHPCQALADWLTLDELEIPTDGKFVLSWAYHPKPLPYAVPAAALRMAAMRGMEVVVHAPEGYNLPPELIQRARSLGAKSVTETSDRAHAMENAHVLYCKSWGKPEFYGNPESELVARAPFRQDWCVRESWFAPAKPNAKFAHCLPVRRNVKVADEVLDGPRSVVLRQAENRLHAQKSVLMELARGERN